MRWKTNVKIIFKKSFDLSGITQIAFEDTSSTVVSVQVDIIYLSMQPVNSFAIF